DAKWLDNSQWCRPDDTACINQVRIVVDCGLRVQTRRSGQARGSPAVRRPCVGRAGTRLRRAAHCAVGGFLAGWTTGEVCLLEAGIMATVADVLKNKKPGELALLPPTASVRDALQLMADRGIGSVMVMDGELLEGIFTERDYARRIV